MNAERVEMTRAQTSGNPMLNWTLRILAPECSASPSLGTVQYNSQELPETEAGCRGPTKRIALRIS